MEISPSSIFAMIFPILSGMILWDGCPTKIVEDLRSALAQLKSIAEELDGEM